MTSLQRLTRFSILLTLTGTVGSWSGQAASAVTPPGSANPVRVPGNDSYLVVPGDTPRPVRRSQAPLPLPPAVPNPPAQPGPMPNFAAPTALANQGSVEDLLTTLSNLPVQMQRLLNAPGIRPEAIAIVNARKLVGQEYQRDFQQAVNQNTLQVGSLKRLLRGNETNPNVVAVSQALNTMNTLHRTQGKMGVSPIGVSVLPDGVVIIYVI